MNQISFQVLDKYQPLAILLNAPDSGYAPSKQVLLSEVRRALIEISELRNTVTDLQNLLDVCQQEFAKQDEQIADMMKARAEMWVDDEHG